MRLLNDRKLSLITMFCVGAFFVCRVSAAVAEKEDGGGLSTSPGLYLKLFGGGNFTDDTDFNGSSRGGVPSGSAELDAGFLTGMSLGYRFSHEFATELEYAYRSNDIDSIRGRGTTFANGGDLASVAIMANALYFIDLDRSWRPYLGAGLGFLQEIDSDISFADGSKIEDLEDQVFAWQAMLGIEVPLSAQWHMLAEARYLSATSPSLSNSRAQYDIDYDNMSLLLGISYQF